MNQPTTNCAHREATNNLCNGCGEDMTQAKFYDYHRTRIDEDVARENAAAEAVALERAAAAKAAAPMVDGPRIYVACLASYNSGTLHGEWIDLEGLDAAEIGDLIQAILDDSPAPDAEEYAIHDHEGMGGLIGEYSSLDEVVRHAAMMSEHGDAWPAFCDHVGHDYATAEGFEEAFRGEFKDEEDYAYQFADDMGWAEGDNPLLPYVDFERFARDLGINDVFFADGGRGVYVFERN